MNRLFSNHLWTRMIKGSLFLCAGIFMATCTDSAKTDEFELPERPIKQPGEYLYVQGKDLLLPNQGLFMMRGTNLAGWLSPDGNLMDLPAVPAEKQLTEMLSQYAGPNTTSDFWIKMRENFIAEADIAFISQSGFNTIRVPFDYRLFTEHDFMGKTAGESGFEVFDKLFVWCRKHGIYVILAMQAAPGGQTGDYTDNGEGYPWLLRSRTLQSEMVRIWTTIAQHYSTEKNLLGYELLDAPLFEPDFDQEYFVGQLEPLYQKVTKAIRKVDAHHIILLDGSKRGANLDVFTDYEFDDNIMYAFQLHNSGNSQAVIDAAIKFSDTKAVLPICMSNAGFELQQQSEASSWIQTLQAHKVGFTFCTYKSTGDACLASVSAPTGWAQVKSFSTAQRTTYDEIHLIKRDATNAASHLEKFAEAYKLDNCTKQISFIQSIINNK